VTNTAESSNRFITTTAVRRVAYGCTVKVLSMMIQVRTDRVHMCYVYLHPLTTHRPHRTESVCSRSLAGIVGSIFGRSGCVFVVHVECFDIQFCVPGCSVAQRSDTECGVRVKR
jgi:hypothetical protein